MDQSDPVEENPFNTPADASTPPPAPATAPESANEQPPPTTPNPPADQNKPKPPLDPNSPSRREIILGLAIMVGWLYLLAIGTLYSSSVYAEKLLRFGPKDWTVLPATCWYYFLYVLTYTVTNTLMLCVLAAALGQAGRRDRIDGDDAHPVQSRPGQYFGAMVRGFMTYLFVVSGSVVIANKTFDNPTRQDYLTFATTVSVLGFLAGFNPEVFVRFMNGIRLSVQPPDRVGSSKSKPAGGDAPNSTNPTS